MSERTEESKKAMLLEGCRDVIARLKEKKRKVKRGQYINLDPAMLEPRAVTTIDTLEARCPACLVGNMLLSVARQHPEDFDWIASDGTCKAEMAFYTASSYDDGDNPIPVDAVELKLMEFFFEGGRIDNYDDILESEFADICYKARSRLSPKMALRVACEAVLRWGSIAANLSALRRVVERYKYVDADEQDCIAISDEGPVFEDS